MHAIARGCGGVHAILAAGEDAIPPSWRRMREPLEEEPTFAATR